MNGEIIQQNGAFDSVNSYLQVVINKSEIVIFELQFSCKLIATNSILIIAFNFKNAVN